MRSIHFIWESVCGLLWHQSLSRPFQSGFLLGLVVALVLLVFGIRGWRGSKAGGNAVLEGAVVLLAGALPLGAATAEIVAMREQAAVHAVAQSIFGMAEALAGFSLLGCGSLVVALIGWGLLRAGRARSKGLSWKWTMAAVGVLVVGGLLPVALALGKYAGWLWQNLGLRQEGVDIGPAPRTELTVAFGLAAVATLGFALLIALEPRHLSGRWSGSAGKRLGSGDGYGVAALGLVGFCGLLWASRSIAREAEPLPSIGSCLEAGGPGEPAAYYTADLAGYHDQLEDGPELDLYPHRAIFRHEGLMLDELGPALEERGRHERERGVVPRRLWLRAEDDVAIALILRTIAQARQAGYLSVQFLGDERIVVQRPILGRVVCSNTRALDLWLVRQSAEQRSIGVPGAVATFEEWMNYLSAERTKGELFLDDAHSP